jgi:peptidoglycan/LPS O-acetylase OafA/YrhL
VVFFHFGPASGVQVAPNLGPIMVTFFFVLSGFVLAITYLPRRMDAGRFLLNRFSRIGPIYYVALAMMLLLLWRQGSELSPVAVGLDLLFLQAWLPPYPMAINPPAWSLSVEAAMYFSFPAVAAFVLRRSPRAALAAAFGCWVLTQLVLSLLILRRDYSSSVVLHDLVNYSPVAHWCSFLLGVAGGHWYLREGQRYGPRQTTVLLFLASLVTICVAVQHSNQLSSIAGVPVAVASSFLAPLFLVLVLSVAVAPAWVGRALSPPPFVVLGNASYSLYILQIPVYLLYNQFLLQGNRPAGLPQLLVFVCALVAISIAGYYVLERPVMRSLRGLWQVPPVPLPAHAVER